MNVNPERLDEGLLSFTIESRIVRELGERLVKQPEIALLELVKNAYDADAEECRIEHDYPKRLIVRDTGHGMTLDEFKIGWMRIGTSSKEQLNASRRFGRVITGEKGIGRFAVRFLGSKLNLATVAFDNNRGYRTRLEANFNWPEFDKNEDLGKVKVPFVLVRADDADETGTMLEISALREDAKFIKWGQIRTSAMSVVTPYHALMRGPSNGHRSSAAMRQTDPGFSLKIRTGAENSEEQDADVASEVLQNFVLRAVLQTKGDRVHLQVGSTSASSAVCARDLSSET
jgi:hypothetical protein